MNLSDARGNQDDHQLAEEAVLGNKQSLEKLIQRHYTFVYNVALKLVVDPSDAEDITQDALVKVITHLSQFKGASSFRTWLYRIVVNHFLDMKRRKMEDVYVQFSSLVGNTTALENMSEEETIGISEEEVEETRLMCTTGMLMCLTREQRLIYILGDVFEIDHTIGAELLSISPDNFRQRLSRTRRELQQFIHNRCELINPSNPCRCPKKTRLWIDQGLVNKEKLQFNTSYTQRVKEVANGFCDDDVKVALELKEKLYQNHPYQSGVREKQFLADLITRPELTKYLNWN